MRFLFSYIRQYLQQANARVHALSVIILAILVGINYSLNLNRQLYAGSFARQLTGWYLLLLGSLALPFAMNRLADNKTARWPRQFRYLLLAAPLVFAWKMTAQVHPFTGLGDAAFWNLVLYFPSKVLVCGTALYGMWRSTGRDESLMGLRSPLGGMRPYLLMLLIMLPLIALAATRPDFQLVYPKLQHAAPLYEPLPAWKVLLFEAAYGSDFFTIELFFRGFLVIYLSRWVGPKAILPAAFLYCVIHFGKPLGECISSFFGGMLLGIISYNTRSIWGGLAVHLGIAWLMEAAGCLAFAS